MKLLSGVLRHVVGRHVVVVGRHVVVVGRHVVFVGRHVVVVRFVVGRHVAVSDFCRTSCNPTSDNLTKSVGRQIFRDVQKPDKINMTSDKIYMTSDKIYMTSTKIA